MSNNRPKRTVSGLPRTVLVKPNEPGVQFLVDLHEEDGWLVVELPTENNNVPSLEVEWMVKNAIRVRRRDQ